MELEEGGLHKSIISLKSLVSAVAPKRCNVIECICCRRIFPLRYAMTLIMVLGLTIAYMQRVGLNLAIVEMVSSAAAEESDSGACPVEGEKKDTNKSSNASSPPPRQKLIDQRFDWDESVQGYILLSFYIGYLIGNIPIGYFTDRYGARWFLLLGMFMSTAGTAVIPPLADYTHWTTLVVSRTIAGAGQATLFPGASSLISQWIPSNRKSSVASIIMTSFTLGTILGNVCTGYIIEWTNSWSWVYYIYGIFGVFWLLLFYVYVYSGPFTHPHITVWELTQLANELENIPARTPPLKNMLSDLAVWSIIIAQFGNDYTLYTIITNMPKYFTTVLQIDLQLTGTLLMLPPAAAFLGSFLFGFTADACISKRIMTHVSFRICCSIIAMPVSSACMIAMVYMGCSKIGANVLLCLAMGLKAAFFNGVGVMALDLSKNYSGLIFGWANASGALAGMLAPYVIAELASENSFPQWLRVQYLSTLIAIVTLLPYLLFAKGGRKTWDYTDDEKAQPPEKEAACKRIWSCYKPE